MLHYVCCIILLCTLYMYFDYLETSGNTFINKNMFIQRGKELHIENQ